LKLTWTKFNKTKKGAFVSVDINSLKKEFPILNQEVYGKSYVYLDNAATTQKPLSVIDELTGFYKTYNSNVHRGVHYLSQKATEVFESSRDKVKAFINAPLREEIIFTKGTTDSVNLVASSFARSFLKEGDEIIISAMEHHSNMIPWRIVAEQYGVKLKYISFNEDGVLSFDQFLSLFTDKTRIVAVGHVSNALGTIHPVKEMIAAAHKRSVPVLIDGAQAVPHANVDVKDLDCDFYCFSAHKMYGPTGVGVLYGKKEWLEKLPPYQGGGEMINTVTLDKVIYNELPYKFEAGTPNVADVVAFGAAIDFMKRLGIENIAVHEDQLLQYAHKRLGEIDSIRIYGNAPDKAAVISFLVGDIHPYDMGTIIDKMGVAVRTGHHCAEPVMEFYNIPGTIRASFGIYNTTEDIDRLVEAVERAKQMFS